MARNYKGKGNTITLIAPSGGVVSGTVYRIQQYVVLALETVAQTLPFSAQRTGIISGVPKVGSQAWALGQVVYWDNGNARFTTTSAAGLTMCGYTHSVVGSGAGETTGDVLLDGAARVNV